MVLRRTLPSRLTGSPATAPKPAANLVPEAAPTLATTPAPTPTISSDAAALAAAAAAAFAVPAPNKSVKDDKPKNAPEAPRVNAIAPQDVPVVAEPVQAKVVEDVPAPVAQPAPAAAVAVDDFAAPTPSTGPRVLEDSFAAAPVATTPAPPPVTVATAEPVAEPVMPAPALPTVVVAETKPAPVVAEPAPAAPSAAAAPALVVEPKPVVTESAPVQVAASTPAAEPAPAQPIAAEAAPAGPTDFLTDNPFANSSAVASKPPSNPLKRRVQKSEAPRPLPTPRPAAATVTSAPAVAEVNTVPDVRPAIAAAAPVAQAQAKAPRVVAPRDFAAATIEGAAAAATAAPAPALNLAPEIPVDTRPLDKVDEELIASGIIAGPAGDMLTSSLPGSMAVAEDPMPRGFDDGSQDGEPMSPAAFSLATNPTAAPSAPMGALPTAPRSSWDVEIASPTPPPDIFKPQGQAGAMPAGFDAGFGAAANAHRVPPPVLPDTRPSRAQLAAQGRPGKSWLGMGVAAAAMAGIGWFVWQQAQAPGGLESASQQLARLTQPRPSPLANAPATDPALLPPPGELAGTPGNGTGNTQIAFAAPAPDPNTPITANGAEPMPDDISLFARLQREVQAARAERDAGTAGAATAAATPAPTEAAAPPLTKEQSDRELAQYKQFLANAADPSTAPKPREFLRDPDAYMDGANTQVTGMPEGALLPPPATKGEAATRAANATLPPPNELYTHNPNNLPIVAEPRVQQAPRIRQLDEFAAEIFSAEPNKVKIPQGVRPQLAATDFPSLEVLSFVPGRGVIATADGKEGVLMVGESINGWQLTHVTSEMAEFKAGERSYYLTTEN